MKSLNFVANLSSCRVLRKVISSDLSKVYKRMNSISVKDEDRLEGSSNFNVWKVRIRNILEEYDLDHFITNIVEEPITVVGRTNFKKNQAKAKRIIFDLLKDSIMPMVAPLKTAKECFDTLIYMKRKHPVRRGFSRTSCEH